MAEDALEELGLQPMAYLNGWSVAAGTDLPPTAWAVLDERAIDLFAESTGDHQWIHTDPARAAEGPFGTTIAHGLLTLSLLARFVQEMLVVTDAGMAINYGFYKVWFPSPVPAGARVRAVGHVESVSQEGAALHAVLAVTIEVEGAPRPACVAEAVARYLP